MRSIVSALLAIHALCAPALAQPPPDHFAVPLRFDQGYLVPDCGRARLTLTERYRKLLRAGTTDAGLVHGLCAALDRELRSMPKPYIFTLTDAQLAQDREGRLDDPEIAIRRSWNGSIRQFPGLRALLESRSTGFNAHLVKVTTRSPLAAWINEEEGALDEPLEFRLRDPLNGAALATPRLGTILDRDGVLAMLRGLEGRPANPAEIQATLLDFYTARDMAPTIDVRLDVDPPSLSIVEHGRLARILVPADLADLGTADRLVYDSLPDPLFRAFRARGPKLLAQPVPAGASHREIALAELDTEPPTPPSRAGLPPIDAMLLLQIQQRLLTAGYAAALFPFGREQGLFDLAIDRLPDAAADPRAAGGVRHRNFVGGGFEYRPDQQVRVFGTYRRMDLFGDDLFQIEAGAAGSGFVTGSYSRDYVRFGPLGRRLAVDIDGGTEFETDRLLDDALTNERRTGAAVRGELEIFRDRFDRHLAVFAQLRRETIRLSAGDPGAQPRRQQDASLDTFDAGLVHAWRRRFTRWPSVFRVEPTIRFGLGFGRGERAFRRAGVAAQFHQLLAGPFEMESRLRAQAASGLTPVFELPALGGADSVRGFRGDELVGRRLWAWQNELWMAVPPHLAPARFREFVRRNVRAAALYDLGRLTGASGARAPLEGLRHGAGAGLRVRFQGVIVEADWAYGFGDGDRDRPGRGRFYFNFRL